MDFPLNITLLETGEEFYVIQHLHAATAKNSVGAAWSPHFEGREDPFGERDKVANTDLPEPWVQVVVGALMDQGGPNQPNLLFAHQCCEYLYEKGFNPFRGTLPEEQTRPQPFEVDVELEPIRPEREAVVERRDRILRRQRAAAAMREHQRPRRGEEGMTHLL
jgi:hypothetical protein